METYCAYLEEVRPQSILDIGVGFGKLGFIAREQLDVMHNESHEPEHWKVKIDGIEVFPDYIKEHQRAIYDDIHIGDACDVINSLGNYDVIILGDSLEHIEKDRAWDLLDRCAERCNRYIFLFIPLGKKWIQPALYGNDHEEHLSFWEKDEIAPFACKAQYHVFAGLGEYGRFLIRKEDYLAHRAKQKAEALFAYGAKQEAIQHLSAFMESGMADLECEYLMVDLLLNDDRVDEAVRGLTRITDKYPEQNPQITKFLAKLRTVRPESFNAALSQNPA